VVAGFNPILTIWPPGHSCRRVPNARHLRFNPRAARHRSRLLCKSRLAHRRPRRSKPMRSSTPQSKQRIRSTSSARSSRSIHRSSSHSSNHSSNHSSKASPRTPRLATAASSGKTALAARGCAWATTSGFLALAPPLHRTRPIGDFFPSTVTTVLSRARTPT
jgi:hypothetical protein